MLLVPTILKSIWKFILFYRNHFKRAHSFQFSTVSFIHPFAFFYIVNFSFDSIYFECNLWSHIIQFSCSLSILSPSIQFNWIENLKLTLTETCHDNTLDARLVISVFVFFFSSSLLFRTAHSVCVWKFSLYR